MVGAPEENEDGLPPHLTRLRRLVTVLTVVMIGGFVVLIATLVIRLSASPLPLPERIELPQGEEAVAFTQGVDWIAVTTSQDRILVYGRATGELWQEIEITRPEN
ncbi:DUF6476 family protein [Histidinibacterium aquaticum]|uniref:Uncharacterized protein n=1 Tax=Histidinibacterium aquaticum TaxID=2613962 RepID=A0A5J5GP96_9RHOB|nr:DUF6476 family protein [Histidinibacterium aquaticum]KAA9010206.1 hypothetical protein F3S47_02860 [Histidinibacterium aquaticum]